MLAFVLTCLITPKGASQVITTVAGTNTIIRSGLSATNTPLGNLRGVAVDPSGNVYATDSGNNILVKILPSGVIQVVGGNGLPGLSGDGGQAANASLWLETRPGVPSSARGIAVDAQGNLFVADMVNQRIRKIASSGFISSVAGGGSFTSSQGDGGPALGAFLNSPNGVAVDSSGNLFIADYFGGRVRKVDPSGIISTVTATVSTPDSLAVDAAGNLYISDNQGYRITKVTPAGVATVVAGTGSPSSPSNDGVLATTARVCPRGVAVDRNGNLYIADTCGYRIRRVGADGIIQTVAGTGTAGVSGDGGPATQSAISQDLHGVAVDQAGNLYFADGQRIRKVDTRGIITTIAGNGQYGFSGDTGPANSAALQAPRAAVADAAGNLYIADTDNHRIRKVNPSGIITTIAGTGEVRPSGDPNLSGKVATSVPLSSPRVVALDRSGTLYFSVYDYSGIVRLNADGTLTTVNSGSAVGAAFDAAGFLYASSGPNVYKFTLEGVRTLVAGTGQDGYSGDNGPATSAQLSAASSLALDAAGNLYIADLGNHRIRKVVPNGTITTVAGNGTRGYSGDGGPATSAQLNYPRAVAVDSAGNLYIADRDNLRVRRVDSSGIITTFAGNGRAGFSGDGGPASNASFSYDLIDAGVSVDPANNVYIADIRNNRIRKIAGSAPTYTVTPATLNFSVTAGSTSAPQVLTLTGSLAGLSWSASAGNANWLRISPLGGQMPASVAVSVDASGLAAGSYQANLQISVPGATPGSLSVAVAATVAPGEPPRLSSEPSALTFETPAGSSGALQLTLRVLNAGSGTLNWTAQAQTSDGKPWLSVTPASGSATPSAPSQLTVLVSPAGLAAGVYSGSIVLAGGGSTRTTSINLILRQITRTILLSQTGLTFIGVEGGGVIPPQTFGVVNVGQGAMSWSAQPVTATGCSWLTVSPSSGSSTANALDVPLVDVGADVTGMRAGQYSCQISVTATGASNSPQLVTVVLNVLPAGSIPPPLVRPTGLIFVRRAGDSSPGSQVVRLATGGIGRVEARANPLTFDPGSWLQAAPGSAAFGPGQSADVAVQPTLGTLTPGQYFGTVALQFKDLNSQSFTSDTVDVLFLVTAPGGSAAQSRASAGPAETGCAPQKLYMAFRTLGAGYVVPLGYPATLEVQVKDDCDTPATGATVLTSFSNGDPPLSLVHVGSGNYQATWSPGRSAPVTVSVQATQGTLRGNSTSQIQVGSSTLNLAAISASGIVNGASFTGGALAPGSIISIFGRGLAAATAGASSLPLPTDLGGAKLRVGDRDVPLFYSSEGQLNAQLPVEISPGRQQAYALVTRSGQALPGVPETITVGVTQPGIFLTGRGTQGVVVDTRGRLVDQTAPAASGEVLVIYATGLGPTNPSSATGVPAPASEPLARVVTLPEVRIGGILAHVDYAGLTPNFVGLYQINVTVPAGVAAGAAVPLVINQSGVVSNTVAIAIR